MKGVSVHYVQINIIIVQWLTKELIETKKQVLFNKLLFVLIRHDDSSQICGVFQNEGHNSIESLQSGSEWPTSC